ncbi:hypothetical protein SBA3_5250001 [Candidatus Sulfopaludibacter sp. SbA3]|nr:hypothetical protein SBA3_5250001 [Candidatus Sulfopaludibacter sp. SbA3]
MENQKLTEWKVDGREGSASASSAKSEETAKAVLLRNFEFRLPLSWMVARPLSAAGAGTGGKTVSQSKSSAAAVAPTSRLKLRFSLWQNRLPVDALPVEGWIELQLVSEWELAAGM